MARRAVLVLPHHGYREEELDAPRQALEAAGVTCELASWSLAPAAGMHGGSALPDRLVGSVDPSRLEALVFVGGSGAALLFEDRAAHRLAREAARQGKVLGAICDAGSILASAGLLEGRAATAAPGREAHLRARGALWTGAPVTVTGRIVTARGPEQAQDFGAALVALLT